MPAVDLTVAVCTRNNARQLPALLASLEAMTIPAGATWEVVLVDNASTDETPAVLGDWTGRLPLRVIAEPIAGLARARNAAVDAAHGALICWTDDDVVVPADWLECYWDAARRHPDAAIFGGRIEPVAESPVTAWFAERMTLWPLSGVTACCDLGDRERRLAPLPNQVPWGANFAVRTEDQKLVRYEPGLAPGEETDVIARLLREGRSGWWLPHCRVSHFIRPERQTREYLAKYFQGQGASAAFLHRRDNGGGPFLQPANRWLRTSSLQLGCLVALGHILAVAARAARLIDVELRMIAGVNYWQGIRKFRRDNRRIENSVSERGGSQDVFGEAPTADRR